MRLTHIFKLIEDISSPIENPIFKRWFGASKVVDAQGKPLICYHGTFNEFNTFRLGSHFGDIAAANTRIKDKSVVDGYELRYRNHDGAVMPVFLRITNPIRITDGGGLSDGWDLAAAVFAVNLIDKETYLYIREPGDSSAVLKRLFEELSGKGYDGLVYKNTIEGNADSWVPFDPKQIKSIYAKSFNPSSANISEAVDDPEIDDVINQADSTLSDHGERAISDFIGGPHDAIKNGQEFGIMFSRRLEGAYSYPPTEESLLARQQIEKQFAPVKAKLKAKYGNTIKLYRGQGEINKDAGHRNVLSWTNGYTVATAFVGGDRKPKKPITDEEIAQIYKTYQETGKAKYRQKVFVRSDEYPEFKNPDYYEIFDLHGENLTDGDDLVANLKDDQEWDTERYAEYEEKLKNIKTANVDIGAIVWVSDRFNQAEFIVQNIPGTPWYISHLKEDAQTRAPLTSTEAFRRWFGNSKVVDMHGQPLRVYKGMRALDDDGKHIDVIQRQSDFPSFNGTEAGVKIAGFFTSDPEVAAKFSFGYGVPGASPSTFPVYLKMENPFIIDAQGDFSGKFQFEKAGAPFRDAIRSGRYDGVIIKNTKDEGDVYIALKPENIKSAIGNNGNFNPTNPKIAESDADTAAVKWVPPKGTQSFRTVWIDVAKFDQAFKRDRAYIGPNGEQGIRNRYQNFGEWLKKGLPVAMPMVYVGADSWRKNVCFGNGRHRYAWMRDHGAKTIPVVVPHDQAKEMAKLYGSVNHDTVISESEGIPLYRGEPVIQDGPKERSHPGGVFFYDARGKQNVKGYARSIQDQSKVGAVRRLMLPIDIYKRLANLHDDKVYVKLLPNENDRSSDLNRGVMPDAKLVAALKAHGYTGYKWATYDGEVQYFILTDYLNGLKYDPITLRK